MNDKKTITIDPRVFINPPYEKCPKCRKDDYGVLGVGVGYTRRCRACWYTQGYELPKLKRRIIYLDQFVLSNMMKSINPNIKVRSGTDISFYRSLFEKLDRLLKLQLIACPLSSTHRDETLTAENRDALKRITEHFSNGIRFYTNGTIQRFQIENDFKSWLGISSVELDVNRVIYGRLSDWSDRLIFSVNLPDYGSDLVNQIVLERKGVDDVLLPLFERWKSEKGKKFNYWLKEEQSAVGRSFWSLLGQMVDNRRKNPYSLESILPTEREVTLIRLFQILRDKGLSSKDATIKINEYFSTRIKEVPHIKISSMLYASMARDASNGRKKPYNKGTLNDVEFISSLLPYCDAMFIDNEFQSRLCDEPIKTQLGYSDKIFSLNRKKEFLEYLDDIEKKMTKSHLDLVNKVYGDWYNHPYVSMFQDNS